MKQYECSKCGREVVVKSPSATLELKCCNGDTPVKFTEKGTKIIVPVAKLPQVMADKTPLLPSTPAKK